MSRLKKKYHRWTDDERQQLIRDVFQVVSEGKTTRYAYLQGRGISPAWFDRMRRTYLAEHPEFDPGKVTGRGPSGWSLDPEERKREMLRRVAKRKAKAKPALEPAVAAALKEYKGLRNAEKIAWREAHNLSPYQMSDLRHGRATPGIVARVLNGQPTVRDQRLARLPDPVPVVNMIPVSAPPPASVPVTLDDAINGFRVYQDHLKEFIDRLVAMRGGR